MGIAGLDRISRRGKDGFCNTLSANDTKGGVFIAYISDETIMLALLEYPTMQEAAKACGIAKATIYRRMQEPSFKAEYAKRRRLLVEAACGALQGKISEAVEALSEIMSDGSAGKMARVQAARAVLEFGIKTVETLDVLPRLEALEEAQKGGF